MYGVQRTTDDIPTLKLMKPTKTSQNNPLEVDFIASDIVNAPGRLALSIAPGKQDEDSSAIWERDLDVDLKRLKDELNITKLICLLEDAELSQLGIPDLLEKANACGIQTQHFQVDDEGKPESLAEMKEVVHFATDAIQAGESILIHCKGGRGRTGMMAAAILVEQGYTPDEAIDLVKQHRKGALTVQIKCDAVHEYTAHTRK